YIKFLDFVGDPIPNLEFNLSNDNNKILMECRTNNDGEAVFVCPKDDFPILSVKSLITNEFKPILRIENNLVREIILVSPKILKEIDLLQETDEKGDYLRSNYHK
ncbi:type IV secretion protein Rhs, partial [Acinetobacter baumannii]